MHALLHRHEQQATHAAAPADPAEKDDGDAHGGGEGGYLGCVRHRQHARDLRVGQTERGLTWGGDSAENWVAVDREAPVSLPVASSKFISRTGLARRRESVR